MSAPLKSRFKRMLLLSFVVILLISGCSPTNSKTNSIKIEDIEVDEGASELVVDDYQALFEDKLIEGMVEAEIHHIHDLIKKEKQTPAEVDWMMKSLKDLKSKDYNALEGADICEVVDWLYNIETAIKLDHLDDIFALHDQVDGAATESYSAIIYELFVESPYLFVQRLSMQDSKSIVSISEELAYYAGYFNVEEIIANTKHIFSEKELSEKEQATVEEIIKALDRQLKGEI